MYHESINPNDYMKITEDNEQPIMPAFPLYAVVPGQSQLNPQPMVVVNSGMTLRDYFAAQALTNATLFDYESSFVGTAQAAYKLADSMLAAREIKPEEL